MALTDEEEKALKDKHQVDLAALTQQVAEANAKAQEVDTLKAQLQRAQQGDGATAEYIQRLKDDMRKAAEVRDAAKVEADKLKTDLEEAKGAGEAQVLELKKQYAVKALLAKSGIVESMSKFALAELDLEKMTLGDDGKLTCEIGGEPKDAAEAIAALKEPYPQFFGSSQSDAYHLAGSPASGKPPSSIKDDKGNISTKAVDERAANAFEKEL